MKPTPEQKPLTPISQRRLARARERVAALGTPLLATALLEYSAREKLSWPELAARLGCDENALNAIALCRPPREESFVEDTKAIAHGYLDWRELLPLLREMQILDAFSAPAAADSVLLAARDYDGCDETEILADETPAAGEDCPEISDHDNHA